MSYLPSNYNEEEALRQAIEDSLVTKCCENDLQDAIKLSKTYEDDQAAFSKRLQIESDERIAKILEEELKLRDDRAYDSWNQWRIRHPIK